MLALKTFAQEALSRIAFEVENPIDQCQSKLVGKINLIKSTGMHRMQKTIRPQLNACQVCNFRISAVGVKVTGYF